MVDLANLGFAVDTGALKDGKAALDALVPSAQRAEKATEAFNNAAVSSGMAASRMAAAAQNAAKSTYLIGGGMDILTGKVNKNFVAINKVLNEWSAIPAAANNAGSALNRLGAAANDNISRLQATPGNIAAQFQDIGVTAAAGMNPMLIALQQGTQLSAAFAGGGLKDLGKAVREMLSPVSLLTIGMVGLVAALLQMVNWVNVGKAALNGMADAVEAAAVPVVAFGAVSIIAFGPQIISTIYSMTAAIISGIIPAIVSATTAMIAFAAANPFTALVLAIGVIVAALWGLDRAFGGVFGDILSGVKNVVNFMISAFLGAFDTIAARARGLAQIITGVATLNGEKIVAGWTQMANAPGFLESIGKRQGRDYVKAIGNGIQSGAKWVAGKFRSFASSLGASDDKKTHIGGGARAGSQADPWGDLVRGAQNDIAAEQARATATDQSALAAATLTEKTKLLNEANTKGIKLTDAMRKQIDALAASYGVAKVAADNAQGLRKTLTASDADIQNLKDQASLIGVYGQQLAYATEMAKQLKDAKQNGMTPEAIAAAMPQFQKKATAFASQSAANDNANFTNNQTQAYEAQVRALTMQQNALGMSAEEAAKYTAVQTILNDALNKHLTLTPDDIALIYQQADSLTTLQTQLSNTKDAWDLVRGSVTGFVSDLRSGLEQGKSLFGTFANAVLNMLNKVVDKLTDVAVNAALGSGNSAGGLLGALGSILHIGGSQVSPSLAAQFDSVIPSAKGNVFNGQGIVTQPTLFKFAKGTGLMGEAGAEAIMPLKRGSDGSLGVQVHGKAANNNAPPSVNINNHYTISGSSTADMRATVRQSAEQTRDQLRREVPSILLEYQRNGGIN